MDISHASHVIVDHCSVSWTLDEGVNTYHGTHYATIRWCDLRILDDSPLRNGHGLRPHWEVGILLITTIFSPTMRVVTQALRVAA